VGRIGTVGYCMGGSRAIHAAAAYPDRIAAAASFHGGRLASDAPDSPHRHVSTIKGRVYVGSAGVDGSFPPEQSALLAEALRRAEIDHIIENYVGMAHGWAVSDHNVYDERGAERHWKRLLTFFEETLRYEDRCGLPDVPQAGFETFGGSGNRLTKRRAMSRSPSTRNAPVRSSASSGWLP
jgi:carboxymethylenebutenolidase